MTLEIAVRLYLVVGLLTASILVQLAWEFLDELPPHRRALESTFVGVAATVLWPLVWVGLLAVAWATRGDPPPS